MSQAKINILSWFMGSLT